jgi:hypothetical protein
MKAYVCVQVYMKAYVCVHVCVSMCVCAYISEHVSCFFFLIYIYI